jgi:tricorn protease-like protein
LLYWSKTDFTEKNLKKYLQDLKSEYVSPLKQLVDKIQAKKDSFSVKGNKDRVLIGNIDKILGGYRLADMNSIKEGILFFRNGKKILCNKRYS